MPKIIIKQAPGSISGKAWHWHIEYGKLDIIPTRYHYYYTTKRAAKRAAKRIMIKFGLKL